ncbi:DUF4919 domain-containing protein [Aquimarina sp. SS2-1]|uniref:DUF4919 domain-containing protein n=1 Tax=Aquimarina besae TaxID=3342247 RepID=UPI00367010C6
MKKIFLLVSLYIVVISCGDKSFKKGPTNPNLTTINSSFKIKDYYKDSDRIRTIVNNENNIYSFKILLDKFQSEKSVFNNKESLALLFGGLTHPGYGSKKLDSLEKYSKELNENKEYVKALKVADQCLEIYPLSIRALMTKWWAHSELKNKEDSKLSSNKASVLLDAMQSLDFNNEFILSHSVSAIDDYVRIHAGGSGLKFKERYNDEYGNLIVYYEGLAPTKATFIIPKK